MSASPSPAISRWRLSLMLAACAAAGAGLRWSVREGRMTGAAGKERGRAGESTAGGGDRRQEKANTASVRPTVVLLLQLPAADRLLAVTEWLPALSAEEVSTLVHAQFTAGTRITDGDIAGGYLRALFTRWAELDAPGMVAALESPALMYELDARQLAVLAWAELRGTAALHAIGKQWPGNARTAAWEMLRRRPGEMEALLPWLTGSTTEGGLQMTATGEEALQLLGPERAITLMAAAGNTRDFDFVISAVAGENFSRALAAVKALPGGMMRDAGLISLLTQLDDDSFADSSLPRPGSTPEDPFAAPEPKDDVAPSADASGGNALTFRGEYDSLPPGRVRDELASRYAYSLARENPGAAVEWARALPAGGPVRGQALERVGDALLEDQPGEAVRVYAEAWLADPARNHFKLSEENDYGRYVGSGPWASTVAHGFNVWLKADPAAAEAWFQTVTEVDLRAELATYLLDSPGHDVSLLPTSEYRLQAVINSGGPFASEPDPAKVPAEWRPLAALHAGDLFGVSDEDWAAASKEDRRFVSEGQLKSLSKDGQKDEALEAFNNMAPEERSLGAWYQAGKAQAERDLGEAAVWMDSLPQGPERDAAATALVERLTAAGDERDGPAAFAWAGSMSGEVERSRYLAQAAQAWALEDAAAARAAVAAAAMPDSEKQALLRQLPEGGGR